MAEHAQVHLDKTPQEGQGTEGKARGNGNHKNEPTCNARPTDRRAQTKSRATSMQDWCDVPAGAGNKSHTTAGSTGIVGARKAEHAAMKA